MTLVRASDWPCSRHVSAQATKSHAPVISWFQFRKDGTYLLGLMEGTTEAPDHDGKVDSL